MLLFYFREVPEGYVLDELREADTTVVFENWGYSREGDTELVRRHLLHLPSVALRDSNGCLVGWYITYYIGEMGMLHVLEEHRGKGVAKCLIYELAKKMIAMNRDLFCYIDVNNVPSVKSHEKCGFHLVSDCDVYFKELLSNTT